MIQAEGRFLKSKLRTMVPRGLFNIRLPEHSQPSQPQKDELLPVVNPVLLNTDALDGWEHGLQISLERSFVFYPFVNQCRHRMRFARRSPFVIARGVRVILQVTRVLQISPGHTSWQYKELRPTSPPAEILSETYIGRRSSGPLYALYSEESTASLSDDFPPPIRILLYNIQAKKAQGNLPLYGVIADDFQQKAIAR